MYAKIDEAVLYEKLNILTGTNTKRQRRLDEIFTRELTEKEAKKIISPAVAVFHEYTMCPVYLHQRQAIGFAE